AGLCRPATGRLVVQTQSGGGQLRVVVMDDNGCRRNTVAADFPLGTPKWAADRERLAYIAAVGRAATLHVFRVDASGAVLCSREIGLSGSLQVTDVAWAAPDALWLFSAATGRVLRYRAGQG